MMELYAKEKTQLHATAKNWSYLGFEIRNAKTRKEGNKQSNNELGFGPEGVAYHQPGPVVVLLAC
jgi:hypothetical protein